MEYFSKASIFICLVCQFSSFVYACDNIQAEAGIRKEVASALPFAASDIKVALVQTPPGVIVQVPQYLVSFTAEGGTFLGAYNIDRVSCQPQMLTIMRAH